MENQNNYNQVPQPQTQTQPSTPTPPTTPVTPTKTKRLLLNIFIILVLILSICTVGFFTYPYMNQKKSESLLCNQLCLVSDLPYRCKAGLECVAVKQPKSDDPGQGETMIALCRNPQCPDKTDCVCEKITPMPSKAGTTRTCPTTEWVDCMPASNFEGIKYECTKEYLDWAKENCPNFKGAAY